MGELMGIAVKALLALLVISLFGAKIILQRQELIAEKEKNATLINDKANRDATIKQLQVAEENNKKRLTQLQLESRRITKTLTEREALIENLQHDDPQLKSWSDAPLPDTIIRLRHRTDTTGASDYHPELSGHQPVLPASSQPEN